ncbi:MAG TPA: hypothetical protein VKB76_19420 [Ktedonobacterales bacterium]|nr:hypothetical protein [Ktedonobacterales bacterium]
MLRSLKRPMHLVILALLALAATLLGTWDAAVLCRIVIQATTREFAFDAPPAIADGAVIVIYAGCVWFAAAMAAVFAARLWWHAQGTWMLGIVSQGMLSFLALAGICAGAPGIWQFLLLAVTEMALFTLCRPHNRLALR